MLSVTGKERIAFGSAGDGWRWALDEREMFEAKGLLERRPLRRRLHELNKQNNRVSDKEEKEGAAAVALDGKGRAHDAGHVRCDRN